MASNTKRLCLQGMESAIFDLVGAGAATGQWAEWLKVPLLHAAAVGDVRLVINLQSAGANGNALHAALKGGQASLARCLVERGESVTRKDENGDSPLHLAAALGDEETVSLLLENGALPNALGRADRAALHVAAEKGHLAAVNVLLDAGADTILRCRDDSALDLAAAKGHVEIATALIRSGADVNATDSTGSSAMHKAACSNQGGVIDVLVEAGAYTDETKHMCQWAPLHCAADGNCLEAILALLKNDALPEELDSDSRTPLHLSARKGHLRATKALLDDGVDVNATDDMGKTALHFAAGDRYEDVTRALLAAGANVDAPDSGGCTALHDAADQYNNTGIIRVLIEAGATVDAREGFNQTPLHVCLPTIDCFENMAVLLECGANPNAQDITGKFPLHSVTHKLTRQDAGKAADVLLRWGADETAVDRNDQTPLQYAEARLGVDNLGCLRDLLTNAPVDRNWRRRGWILLYRAYPRRMRPIPGTGAAPSDRAKKGRASSVSAGAAGGVSDVLGKAEGAAAGGGEGVPGGWSGVVTWVMGVGLEGVFRNVVKYL